MSDPNQQCVDFRGTTAKDDQCAKIANIVQLPKVPLPKLSKSKEFTEEFKDGLYCYPDGKTANCVLFAPPLKYNPEEIIDALKNPKNNPSVALKAVYAMSLDDNMYYATLRSYDEKNGKGSFEQQELAKFIIDFQEKVIRKSAPNGDDTALSDPRTGTTIENIVEITHGLQRALTKGDEKEETRLLNILAGNQTLRERVAILYTYLEKKDVVVFEEKFGSTINATLIKHPENYAAQGYLTYLSANQSFNRRTHQELNKFFINRLKENNDRAYWEKIVLMASDFKKASGFFWLFKDQATTEQHLKTLVLDPKMQSDLAKVYNFLNADKRAFNTDIQGRISNAHKKMNKPNRK